MIWLVSGAVDTATVTFIGSGGTLAWAGSGAVGATLAGFTQGETLDLTKLSFASGGVATRHGLVLDVTEHGTTDTITFASGADHFGPPIAPRSTASASRQGFSVLEGRGSPQASIAAPPNGS